MGPIEGTTHSHPPGSTTLTIFLLSILFLFIHQLVVAVQVIVIKLIGSLSNHDDDGNKNPTNLHIWQQKTVFFHALHVHFSFIDIL